MRSAAYNAALKETAYAKINLALHVRGRRDDGYHILDTIFAFVDDGDIISAEYSDGLSLRITGPYAAGLRDTDNNLVMLAARILHTHYNIKKGAALTLEKRLPIASGIGGGSADAAAAVRLLCKLWQINATTSQLASLLAPHGADIPACIGSITVRGHETGTQLEQLENTDISGTPILLVNPNVAVSTAAVFSRWTGSDGGALAGNGAAEMMISGGNDLQPFAIEICPEINDVMAALSTQNPIISRMSGSGATCFALFPNETECLRAKKIIQAAYPNYWTMTGKLR